MNGSSRSFSGIHRITPDIWEVTLVSMLPHNVLLDNELHLTIELILLREYDKVPEERLTCAALSSRIIREFDQRFNVEKK